MKEQQPTYFILLNTLTQRVAVPQVIAGSKNLAGRNGLTVDSRSRDVRARTRR